MRDHTLVLVSLAFALLIFSACEFGGTYRQYDSDVLAGSPFDYTELPDAFRNAMPLTVGEPVQGRLKRSGDKDAFMLRADQGEIYHIDVVTRNISDPDVRLYFSTGDYLDHFDPKETHNTWRVGYPGEYYFEVSGLSSGHYTLTVSLFNVVDDHGESLEGATFVRIGETDNGVLDHREDVDTFVFKAEKGELYDISVTGGSLPEAYQSLVDALVFKDEKGNIISTGGRLPRAYLSLFDAKGEFLAGDDPLLPQNRIIWEAPRADEYYISLSCCTGTYTLSLATSDIDDHSNLREEATAIMPGEEIQGALQYRNDDDIFSFETEEGELYEIDLTPLSAQEAWLRLYDSRGINLAEDIHQPERASIVWRAENSGEYFIYVECCEGSYSLTLSASGISDDDPNSQEEASVVTVGGSAEGAVDYRGDQDFFAFEAEQGVLYEMQVVPQSFELGLYDHDGLKLATALDHDGDKSTAVRIAWQAEAYGEYGLRVGGGVEGSYTLTVAVSSIDDDHSNSEVDATPVTVGEAVLGDIDYRDDSDFFEFTPVEGQFYDIIVEPRGLPFSRVTLYGARMNVVDTQGNFLESFLPTYRSERQDRNDTPAEFRWEAWGSRSFYVEVTSLGVGEYTLSVLAANDPEN